MIPFNSEFSKIFNILKSNVKSQIPKFIELSSAEYNNDFPYIGMGNPNADILLVGKEKALSSDSLYNSILTHELNLNFFHWNDLVTNGCSFTSPLDPSILNRTGSLNGFNPFNPLLYNPTFKIVYKKHGHTYYGIQRLINKLESINGVNSTSIFESTNFSNCTFSKIFLTELNTNTALTSSESDFKISTFLKCKNGRYDFMKNCDFYKRFKVVIIYAGKDLKYVGKDNSSEREALIQIFNPHLTNSDCITTQNFQIYHTNIGSTVILCRHFSGGFSNALREEIAELLKKINSLLKIKNELQLFETLKNIIDPNLEIKRPKIIIKDHCECDMKEDPGIFDILGYFSYEIPDSMFLCKKNIEKYCEEHKQNIDFVSEIIYLHETAHYLHYHLNSQVFGKNDKISSDNRKLFIESFAQLLTHKAAQETSSLYFEIFEYLKQNQPFEYVFYDEVMVNEKHPISACPEEVLFNVFLNSHQIYGLMEMFEKSFKVFIVNHPSSKNLDKDKNLTIEECVRLNEMGLFSILNFCDFYNPFIEKNI